MMASEYHRRGRVKMRSLLVSMNKGRMGRVCMFSVRMCACTECVWTKEGKPNLQDP